MDTTEQTSRATFPNARMLMDGWFATPQGNVVQTTYVDLAGTLPPEALCLAKASESQFDIRTADSLRISRPSVFRKTGEVLVKDEQEGRATRTTRKTIKSPIDTTSWINRRLRAINAALRLSHAKPRVSATSTAETTNTATSALTFGTDWLIYCTSLWPEAEKEDAWRRTFPENYTSVARIHRPTQFAQALGLGVCEHIGATGKPVPMSGNFHGFKSFEVQRTPQLVLHGPVLYVDDPYDSLAKAETGWAKTCAMTFVKSREYAEQKEYRFVMLSIRPEAGEVFDLPVSGMLRDCLLPMESPVGVANGHATMTHEQQEPRDERETYRGYTYQRRSVRRESGGWSDEQPGSRRVKEEVLEETVTSPEDVPEPFTKEAKQPDIIVFERIAGQIRFTYHVYREEEPRRMRIETVRTNPAINDDSGLRNQPKALEVPPEEQLEALEEAPTDPRGVLELCLNPSVPMPPKHYDNLTRYNRTEWEHALACSRSLNIAVNKVDEDNRERAAASAWYAAEFIVDLVSSFGPIVKSVCVIREYVAVVEFKRAPLSKTVGWATFSGTGTYTLRVHRGNVEEIVFSGHSQAGKIAPSTYIETLQKYGWHPKTGAGSGALKPHKQGQRTARAKRTKQRSRR